MKRSFVPIPLLVALFVAPAYAGEGVAVVPEKTAAKTLFEQVLELNRVQEPELDLAACRTVFKDLLSLCREELKGTKTPRQKVAALNKILLADRKVSYLSNLYWRDSTLAAGLLRKRGNCLSTSTLYVVVGDELGAVVGQRTGQQEARLGNPLLGAKAAFAA